MQDILLLIGGLFGLWLGTNWVVRGTVNVTEYYGLSRMFTGLTILAIGTDLPELVISVNGAIHKLQGVDTSGVIVGNAIGSTIGQMSIVLGIASFFGVLHITGKNLLEQGAMLIGSVVLLFLVGIDGLVGRVEGILLVVVYIIYYVRLFTKEKFVTKIQKKVNQKLFVDLFLLGAGMAVVIIASELVVTGALDIAETFGIRSSVIGLTIIGLGTSLPELALSVTAMMKREESLSIGNILGSSIFDLLIPVGAGASIAQSLNFEKSMLCLELPMLFVISGIVIFIFKKHGTLMRKEAVVLMCIYIGYIALKLFGF